jgi:hypothetical protein
VCIESSTREADIQVAKEIPKQDIEKPEMKRRITTGDIQAALEGFVGAGLVREFSTPAPPESSVDKAGLESHAASKKRGRTPFGKRERALIKQTVEEFCARFMAGGTVFYIGDAEDKFVHLDAVYLKRLGVEIPAPAKMPDVIVHDTRRNWLVLIEVVTSAGPVDGKRRKELKELFAGSRAGLVFVTAFSTREIMRSFLTQISWETEVWVAEDPEHLIHFNGERFLGPYPDVMPQAATGG